MIKKILVTIGIVISITGLSGVSEAKEKVTIAAFGEFAAPVYIAHEKGYFDKNGVDVIVKDYEAGKICADAMIAGEADLATCAETVFVSNSFDHADLRIICTLDKFKTQGIIARRDHGILKPQDLKGKKIGVTRKSGGEFFLWTFLSFHYLTVADIEIVDLPPSEIVKSMLSGEIDAASSWDPHIYNIANELADKAIVWPQEEGEAFYFLLITKSGWIKDHPEAARRIVGALIEAEKFLKENAAGARGILAKRFHYDDPYMDHIWPKFDYKIGISQALVVLLENVARWRIENKLTDKKEVPNYLDYIYKDALEDADPKRVTIIR
jgi:NitT/TauT family transport system substrate-binding protein